MYAGSPALVPSSEPTPGRTGVAVPGVPISNGPEEVVVSRPVTWQGMARQSEAALRRLVRAERSRLRELNRLAKEAAKLSALEQARLEVEQHEGEIELLLSVHKERGPEWNWHAVAAAPVPWPPTRASRHETRAMQHARLTSLGFDCSAHPGYVGSPADGRVRDDLAFQRANDEYSEACEGRRFEQALSDRILSQDPSAYEQALRDIAPFDSISDLCADVECAVPHPRLAECRLRIHGAQIIPAEVKSLTSTGKVSVRPMPRHRAHDLFQDYACSCSIRVAREVFCVIPVDIAIVTAYVPASGTSAHEPVLSVAFQRAVLAGLDFETLDPSDTVQLFTHRGDVLASKRTGTFTSVVPLASSDLRLMTEPSATLDAAVAEARALREEMARTVATLTSKRNDF